MGRTPDAPLKARARQITQAHGGGSAADAIRLTVQLVGAAPHGATASEGAGTIGRAVCAFQYDADIVAALKQLAPIQRSYSALTKEWPVDLLALPDLLAHLAQLHYVPPPRLAALSSVCERLETLLYQPAAAAPVSSTPGAAASAAAPAAGCDLDDISDEALFAVDIDEIVASQSSQQGGQQGGQGDQGGQGGQGGLGGQGGQGAPAFAPGTRVLISGLASAEVCACCRVHGACCRAHAAWCVVHAAWCMVHVACCMRTCVCVCTCRARVCCMVLRVVAWSCAALHYAMCMHQGAAVQRAARPGAWLGRGGAALRRRGRRHAVRRRGRRRAAA